MIHLLLGLGPAICSFKKVILLQYCLVTLCANGLNTEIIKKIGAAIAPIAIANGNPIRQHKPKQEHPLTYLAKTQGDTIIPITQVKAIPTTSMMIRPTIKNGKSIVSPSRAKNEVPFGICSA